MRKRACHGELDGEADEGFKLRSAASRNVERLENSLLDSPTERSSRGLMDPQFEMHGGTEKYWRANVLCSLRPRRIPEGTKHSVVLPAQQQCADVSHEANRVPLTI